MQFDLLRSESHDLSQEGLWQHIFSLLGQGDWILLASPPCETFSRVRHHQPGPRPLRSASYPRGFPWLSNKHRLQVDQSNYFIDQTLVACQLAWQFWLEHPEDLGATTDHDIPAFIWQWESVRELQVSTKAARFDSQQRYVGPLPPRCPHDKHDKALVGKSGNEWLTKGSAAYPALMCEWLAHSVLASASQGGRSSAQHSGGRSSAQQAGSGVRFSKQALQ